MDPNKTLAQIRDCLLSLFSDEKAFIQLPDEVQDLATHVDDLDEWLTKGGFFPRDWERKRE